MRHAWLLLALTVACSPNSGGGAHDASDGGGCPPDASVGPLGSCITGCVNTCASDSDCPPGSTCNSVESDCRRCAANGPVDGGSCQQSGECRNNSDCCGGAFCIAPGDNEFQCGGPCPPPPNECDDQHPCTDGGTCIVAPTQPCACNDPNGPGHICFVPCTATSCGTGQLCGSDGHCRAQQCDEGFACAPDDTCQPDAGDAHGCVVKLCGADSACKSGFCVNGVCRTGPGQCAFPPI